MCSSAAVRILAAARSQWVVIAPDVTDALHAYLNDHPQDISSLTVRESPFLPAGTVLIGPAIDRYVADWGGTQCI